MKKMLVIFMIVICCCGIGYVGYLIFRSKNIKSVELVGQIQTLYVVGDEIDFEDAQLKVTYKNGNIKMKKLSTKMVDYFSTSIGTHATMQITYKSEVLKIDYDVLYKGGYYLKSTKTSTATQDGVLSTTNTEYVEDDTNEIVYIDSNGVIKYYVKGTKGWCVSDGNYINSYSYTIVGDTLKVKLGQDSYDIKVKYSDAGKMILTSNNLTTIKDSNLVIKEEIKTFDYHTGMKTNETIAANGVVFKGYLDNDADNQLVKLKVGDKLNTLTPKVYLKVTYVNYDNQFRTVYVEVNDKMVNGSYDTSSVRPENMNSSVEIVYNGQKCTMFYYVALH